MASQGVLAPPAERYLMREQKVCGSVVASDSLQPHLQDFCIHATDLRFAALVEHLERPHPHRLLHDRGSRTRFQDGLKATA